MEWVEVKFWVLSFENNSSSDSCETKARRASHVMLREQADQSGLHTVSTCSLDVCHNESKVNISKRLPKCHLPDTCLNIFQPEQIWTNRLVASTSEELEGLRQQCDKAGQRCLRSFPMEVTRWRASCKQTKRPHGDPFLLDTLRKFRAPHMPEDHTLDDLHPLTHMTSFLSNAWQVQQPFLRHLTRYAIQHLT